MASSQRSQNIRNAKKQQIADDQRRRGGDSLEMEEETIISKEVIDGINQGTTASEVCGVHDACRVCSFKELQVIPECQGTGFRLIKRCVLKEQDRVVEDKYLNEQCTIYNGTHADYLQNQEKLGSFAEPGTEPLSLGSFMFMMLFFASVLTWFLNRRKERILNEIYSKISIVDR